MKSIISIVFVLLFTLAIPSTVNAQFFKKLKNKIEKKTDKVLGLNKQKSDNSNAKETENTSTTNPSNSNDENVGYPEFVRGEILIFSDIPNADEEVHETPSNWRFVKSNADTDDNLEIVTFEGEKVIRLPKRDEISPVIIENDTDYLPENFTLEFDASFSENSLEQRYYLSFYDRKTQVKIVEYEAGGLEFTFTTFGVTDDFKEGTLNNKGFYEESPNLVWRHIAISYTNNNIDIYYDGQHIFQKAAIKGNLIGITISRSEFSDNNRYLKNIRLATNQ